MTIVNNIGLINYPETYSFILHPISVTFIFNHTSTCTYFARRIDGFQTFNYMTQAFKLEDTLKYIINNKVFSLQ